MWRSPDKDVIEYKKERGTREDDEGPNERGKAFGIGDDGSNARQ